MHCREVLRRDCALQVCIKLRAPTPEAMRRDPAATMVLASSCGRRSGKQVFRQGAETAPGFVGKTANDHATRWRVALSFLCFSIRGCRSRCRGGGVQVCRPALGIWVSDSDISKDPTQLRVSQK